MANTYNYIMQTNKQNEASHTSKDWNQIKYDYMTGASMRELSRRYHTAVSTISVRAKKEGWTQTIKKVDEQVSAEIEQKVIANRLSNTDKAMEIIDTLMEKMQKAVKTVNPKDVNAMKSLVASMKDLKELGVYEIKSTTDDTVKVVFEGGTEDYGD